MSNNPRASADFRRRAADTFFAPRALAAAIRERPRWAAPLLIATGVAILAVALLPDSVFLEEMRDPVTRRGRAVEITSEPAEIARWGRYLAMMAASATYPLLAFAIAALLAALFTLLWRGRATYVEHLSLTSHALLIPSLGTLLAFPIQLALRDPGFQFSLGTLVGLDAANPQSGLLAGTLEPINLFTIWMIVVLGVGISALEPRHTPTRVIALLIALYLLMHLALAIGVRA